MEIRSARRKRRVVSNSIIPNGIQPSFADEPRPYGHDDHDKSNENRDSDQHIAQPHAFREAEPAMPTAPMMAMLTSGVVGHSIRTRYLGFIRHEDGGLYPNYVVAMQVPGCRAPSGGSRFPSEEREHLAGDVTGITFGSEEDVGRGNLFGLRRAAHGRLFSVLGR